MNLGLLCSCGISYEAGQPDKPTAAPTAAPMITQPQCSEASHSLAAHVQNPAQKGAETISFA